MADRKISIRELKKEKRQIEKELDELVEEKEDINEIAKAAAAVPLPKGKSLEETKIAIEEKKAEGEEEEFFLTTTTPRRRTFDDSTGETRRQFENEDEEEKEKEKPEDKYKLPSGEEAENPTLDPHEVISDMIKKGMIMDREEVKEIGMRKGMTKFHDMLADSEASMGRVSEAPAEKAEKATGLQAVKYKRAANKEKEKAQEKAFGKHKESSYKEYKV